MSPYLVWGFSTRLAWDHLPKFTQEGANGFIGRVRCVKDTAGKPQDEPLIERKDEVDSQSKVARLLHIVLVSQVHHKAGSVSNSSRDSLGISPGSAT